MSDKEIKRFIKENEDEAKASKVAFSKAAERLEKGL